jgi:hypothetical protein
MAPVMLIGSAGFAKKNLLSRGRVNRNRFSAFEGLLEEQSKGEMYLWKKASGQ